MAAKKKQTGDALLTAALAIPRKEVRKLSFDLNFAKGQLRVGLQRAEKFRAELKKLYPGIEFDELLETLELCDRAIAQQRIVQKANSSGSIAERVNEALSWRRRLLPAAQILAESGLVNARALAAIVGGKGVNDNVRDVIDLVKLLAPQKAQVEKMLGTGAIDSAAAAAEAAVQSLSNGAAPSKDIEEAAELRDRYATLIVQRHDRLRAAFAVLVSYREAEQLAPPLIDGSRGKAAAPAAPSA